MIIHLLWLGHLTKNYYLDYRQTMINFSVCVVGSFIILYLLALFIAEIRSSRKNLTMIEKNIGVDPETFDKGSVANNLKEIMGVEVNCCNFLFPVSTQEHDIEKTPL